MVEHEISPTQQSYGTCSCGGELIPYYKTTDKYYYCNDCNKWWKSMYKIVEINDETLISQLNELR